MNKIMSRMERELVKSMASRSMPMPSPPGGKEDSHLRQLTMGRGESGGPWPWGGGSAEFTQVDSLRGKA